MLHCERALGEIVRAHDGELVCPPRCTFRQMFRGYLVGKLPFQDDNNSVVAVNDISHLVARCDVPKTGDSPKKDAIVESV